MLGGWIVSLIALHLVFDMDVVSPHESTMGLCLPLSTNAIATFSRAVLTVAP